MKNFLLAERYARGLMRSLTDTATMERASEGLDILVELYEQHRLRAMPWCRASCSARVSRWMR